MAEILGKRKAIDMNGHSGKNNVEPDFKVKKGNDGVKRRSSFIRGKFFEFISNRMPSD